MNSVLRQKITNSSFFFAIVGVKWSFKVAVLVFSYTDYLTHFLGKIVCFSHTQTGAAAVAAWGHSSSQALNVVKRRCRILFFLIHTFLHFRSELQPLRNSLCWFASTQTLFDSSRVDLIKSIKICIRNFFHLDTLFCLLQWEFCICIFDAHRQLLINWLEDRSLWS